MVTFAVDEVEAVLTPLPRAAFDLKKILGAEVLATSPHLEDVVAAPNFEPFFGANGLALAVHLAFSQHRPLTLSPDAMWLVILQGFALHVREHEAELRERFVRHQGKKTISLGAVDEAGWPAIVDGFVAALGKEVNPGLLKALSDRFSTTGETEHTAHCIAVMDSFSRFFDYELTGICGIPTVTLLGTAADWTALRRRFRVLAEYGLQWWADRLDPVLEQFVEAAEGRPNRANRELHGLGAIPALLFEFYSRFDGGPIYDGALSLTPAPRATGNLRNPAMFVPLRIEGRPGEIQAITLFGIKLGVLRDCGELILVYNRRAKLDLVLLRKSPTAPPPWDVVANSLLEFYQRLADVQTFPPWEVRGSWSPEPGE